MENLYLNTEIKLTPEQQSKLFEGIDAMIDEKIEDMDTRHIVTDVVENLDLSDVYYDMKYHIEDDFADKDLLDSALDRIEKLEEALTGVCQALFKEFNPPDEPEESDAE